MNSINKVFEEIGTLRVTGATRVIFPWAPTKEEGIDVSSLTPRFEGCYASNNGTVAFVSQGEFFVAPYTRKLEALLKEKGFKQAYFFVPFSNGDYPKYERHRWEALQKAAQKTYEEDFVADCARYCDKNRIGAISDELLRNCFKMPKEGVRVKHPVFEDRYFPVLEGNCFDITATMKIGTYCHNNGRLVFIYRDGATYVAKDFKVLDAVRKAGYKNAGLFVPFSNGERIVDPILRERWESLPEE